MIVQRFKPKINMFDRLTEFFSQFDDNCNILGLIGDELQAVLCLFLCFIVQLQRRLDELTSTQTPNNKLIKE